VLPNLSKITVYQLDTGDITVLGSTETAVEMQQIAGRFNTGVISPKL
jgi:hypothetical protein